MLLSSCFVKNIETYWLARVTSNDNNKKHIVIIIITTITMKRTLYISLKKKMTPF